ncbi:hypothetical protein BJ742DRAFT_787479 [Cladochytrium replicatum]|nr:hypothetical protein BJ742DRAFT_787479 [Cladochytrium replicatum]
MGINETFQFDEEAYAEKLRNLSAEELCRMLHSKTVRMMMTSTATGSSVGAAFFTFGFSLVPGMYSARQTRILHLKRQMIKAEYQRRGLDRPKTNKKDLLIGGAIGLATCGVAAMLPAMDHMVGTAVTAPMDHIHAAAQPAGEAIHSFGQGVANTIQTQAHNLATQFAGHGGAVAATNYVPADGAQYVGAWATVQAEHMLACEAVKATHNAYTREK